MYPTPSSSNSVFANLPARPPTPPKDVSKDVDIALRFLVQGHDDTAATTLTAGQEVSISTPPSRSPASSQQRDSVATKKVDFSPWPTYHDISLDKPHRLSAVSVGKVTPPAKKTKPLKSILKTTSDNLPPTPDDLDNKLSYFSPADPGSFHKMLQSVLNQLASTSRDDRRDAYLAINGALKVYEGVPDPQAVVEKIAFLQQFLTRDIAWKDANGRLDFSVITQALQLTTALLFNPRTRHAFDHDFRSFLVERSIMVLELSDAPKAILKAHLYLLCQQQFDSSTMTATRTDRLVNTLQSIEDRCSGNSAISARLIIYQRLIEQAPSSMLHRMPDWFEHVFHGFLSSTADIRLRAIELCNYAGRVFGEKAVAGKTLSELLGRADEDGATYFEFLNLRLKEMSGVKELAALVPQIWSGIILFFRNKTRSIDRRWPRYREWLATIQKCLNSGEVEVKHQANIAWNKLVFCILPDSSTAEMWRCVLKIPIVAGLEKRGGDRNSLAQRQIALNSYCNLLHYSLRPGLTPEDYDCAWDLYVGDVISKMTNTSGRGRLHACQVIQGLLTKNTGLWNANAAIEAEPIRPGDLPRLDVRWIRSRLSKIIAVIEPMLLHEMWLESEASKAVDACWKSFMECVAEAGAQEVKTSNDLREAIAQLTNFYRRLWTSAKQPRTETEGHKWLERWQSLLEVSVNAIGAGHFVEDILSRTSSDEVEATPTPSHRTSKHHPAALSSFAFLSSLYYQPPPQVLESGHYIDSFRWFLRLLANAKSSTFGALGLLNRTLQFCSNLETDSTRTEVSPHLWAAVAEAAKNATEIQVAASPHARGTQVMGVALRSGLNILTRGLYFADENPWCMEKATDLYIAIHACAKFYGGDGGVALGVMEPLAKTLSGVFEELSIATLHCICKAIFDTGVWPKSRQDLEQGQKALWTISLELPKTQVFDPFEDVYSLSNKVFRRAYHRLGSTGKSPAGFDDFVKSLVNFLQRCPATIMPTALRSLQAGPCAFIEDRCRLVFPLTTSRSPELVPALTIDLCSAVMRLIQAMPHHDSLLLESLEALLVAGLSSPSKTIVNEAITSWNETFGRNVNLEYSAVIKPILVARKREAELLLPGFPDETNEIAELPAFAESQVDEVPPLGNSSWVSLETYGPESTRNLNAKRKEPALKNDSRRRPTSAHSSRKSTPRTKLRHEDSQIAFAPIEPDAQSQSDAQKSQLLTDHQREVKMRQRGDAQMFPDLSSSPIARSSARKKSVAKRLDFSSDYNSGQPSGPAVETPSGLADGNPMSDDLPSSPTPRAQAVNESAKKTAQYSDDDEETICDPPSSPPRQDDSPARDAAMDRDGPAVVKDAAADPQESNEEQVEIAEAEHGEPEVSDLPSDTILPTAQLEREAAAAEREAHDVAAAAAALNADKDNTEQSKGAHGKPPVEDNHGEEPSRADDSFLPSAGERISSSRSNTPKFKGKKRKRSTEDRDSAPNKRRSPLKKIFDKFFSQEEEDIGEEIVVASSQVRSPSPSEDVVEGHSSEPAPDASTSRVAESQQEEPQQSEQHTKRKPGRPKKSNSPKTDSQQSVPQGSTRMESGTSTRLKRKASAASLAATEDYASTDIVKDTPAVPKKKKKHGRKSEESTESHTTSREVVAVMPSPLDKPQAQAHSQSGLRPQIRSNENDITAEGQLPPRESGKTNGRRIAQPKSILGRLRGVLDDCKKMVFGSQDEEREFDDILFEIRREVHEAGRRAREAQ